MADLRDMIGRALGKPEHGIREGGSAVVVGSPTSRNPFPSVTIAGGEGRRDVLIYADPETGRVPAFSTPDDGSVVVDGVTVYEASA